MGSTLAGFTEECGLRVTRVYKGRDIIPMVRMENPVVILLHMDLLGRGKSLEVLQSLKKDPATCHIPVLVFSWQKGVGELVEGMATHLQEPVAYDDFAGALRKAGVSCRASV